MTDTKSTTDECTTCQHWDSCPRHGASAADPAAVQALRSMIEAGGFTIEGLDDSMTRAEVRRISVELAAKMTEYVKANA